MKRLFLVFFTLPFILSACAGNYAVLPVDSGSAVVNNLAQEQNVSVDSMVVNENIQTGLLGNYLTEVSATRESEKVEVDKVEEKKIISESVEVVIVDTQINKISLPVKQEITADVPLSNNNTYVNVDGNEVHSPAYAPSVPVGASAVCRDGTYSFSQHRSGTCSGHGGVARWL